MKKGFFFFVFFFLLGLNSLLFPAEESPPSVSYTFVLLKGKVKEELELKVSPPYLRIDRPKELFSVVYNEQEDSFLGMEHRDGRYWKFSWKTIQKAVEKIKESSYHIRRDPYSDPSEQSLDEILNPSFFPHYGRFEPFGAPPQLSWTKSSQSKSSPFGELFQWVGKDEKTQAVCWIQPLTAEEAANWDWAVPLLRKACQILSFLLGENAWPSSSLDIWASLPPKAGIPIETRWTEEENALVLFLQRKRVLSGLSWTNPPQNYLSEELSLLEEYKNP
ncbi:hypothetical protein EM20IM_04135 [Candidatus Methylacidiphilum infernorum]|uniref:Uncharacterized protein n=1 Tax=Candidatus Methylacidiphilum infernorum TaxID=511746 RepID=A0ABX7PXY6_9BACT|nr:hypothetical protein EM20IM_04135 [Candidatus Methylacidiphilum infernorum]